MDTESTATSEQPLGSHEDLPTLPAIPRFHDDSRAPKVLLHSRKRARIEDASNFPSTSSDPAVFSSDDDPALENVGRHKKRYVGSWFQQVPTSSDSAFGDDLAPPRVIPKRKRSFRRQFDSGVYMGCVGSIDSSDAEVETGATNEARGQESDRPGQRSITSRVALPRDNSDEPETYLPPRRPNPHSDAYYRRLAIERAMPHQGADEAAVRIYFQALVEHGNLLDLQGFFESGA